MTRCLDITLNGYSSMRTIHRLTTYSYLRKKAISIQLYAYRKNIFDKSRLSLPDFLCIGAIKCGTTWLYENLRLHPEIFLPQEKETYFFHFRYGAYPISWYSGLFEDGKDKGDITPGYSLLTRSRIKEVKDIVPNAKLIFMMRNPIERDWSDAYMLLVSKTDRSISMVSESEIIDYLTSDQCRQRGNYLRSIDNWLSAYPENRLFISFLDNVQSDPEIESKKIFSFLEVNTPDNFDNYKLRNRIAPVYETNKQVKHGRVVDKTDGISGRIPDKYLDLLKNIYQEDIKKLGLLYGAPSEKRLAI